MPWFMEMERNDLLPYAASAVLVGAHGLVTRAEAVPDVENDRLELRPVDDGEHVALALRVRILDKRGQVLEDMPTYLGAIIQCARLGLKVRA